MHPAQGKIMPKADVLRIQLQGPLIIPDGILVFPLAYARDASYLIGVHHKRVSLQRFAAVRLSALIVVKIHLGKTAVEERLRHVRLCVNYLIEILNGQHIVLKIERVLSDGHHPFGIDLCR